MWSRLLFLTTLVALVVIPLAHGQVAVATMYGTTNDQTVRGTVTFTKLNDTFTRVDVAITGITIGADADHGMHIHEYGDVQTDPTAGTSVGSHWVGSGSSTHGCPNTGDRHAGDMGLWTAVAGVITASKELNLLTWDGDSVIGHAVVLHELPDDCVNVPSSGSRLALGVIGHTNFTAPNYNPSTAVTLATCYLRPTDVFATNTASGSFTFQQVNNEVKIYGAITGLVDGSVHGLHIHWWGDVSHRNASWVGLHWDPTSSGVHALPPTLARHYGDLGNINTYSGGVAYYDYAIPTTLFTLNEIIGRGLVLHERRDDGCTPGAGDSGVRLAQCTIGIAHSTYIPTFPTPPVTVPAQVGSQCTSPSAPTTPAAPQAGSSGSITAASLVLVVVGALFALIY